MTAIPADRLRGVVALIGAGEITPCARRLAPALTAVQQSLPTSRATS